MGGLDELVRRYAFIGIVRFLPALHRSSDTSLPPLKPVLPRAENKKPPVGGEELGSMGYYVCVGKVRFAPILVISNNSDPRCIRHVSFAVSQNGGGTSGY